MSESSPAAPVQAAPVQAAPVQAAPVQVAPVQVALSPPPSAAMLTHTDASGRATMVDVGGKAITARSASASGTIRMTRSTLAAIRDNQIAKGDVLGVARIAGIMAAKRTSDLIPLCHPVPVTRVDVELGLDDSIPGVRALATASTVAQTGIEMEAIVAVTIALATIYDMAKSADRAMVIGDIRLESKTGGASGSYSAEGAVVSAASR